MSYILIELREFQLWSFKKIAQQKECNKNSNPSFVMNNPLPGTGHSHMSVKAA